MSIYLTGLWLKQNRLIAHRKVMMKWTIFGALFAVICLPSQNGLVSAQPIVQTPIAGSENDPKCTDLANAWENMKNVTRTELPDIYGFYEYGVAISFGIDLNEEQFVRTTLCNALHASSPKDVFPTSQSAAKLFSKVYPYYQKLFGFVGGYTNVRRILGANQDFEVWRKGLGIRDAKALRNVTTVESVTSFLNTMSVKYGSGWLSFIAFVEEMGIVLTSPEDMARNLYESNDRQEFADRTGLSFSEARSLWFAFYRPYLDLSNTIEPTAVFCDLVGDYGLLNIPT